MDPDEGAAVGPQITIAPPPSILSKEDMAKLQKTYDRTLSMEEEEADLEAEDEDKYNSEAPCGLQLSASGNHLVHPAVTVQHHNGGGGGGGGAGNGRGWRVTHLLNAHFHLVCRKFPLVRLVLIVRLCKRTI